MDAIFFADSPSLPPETRYAVRSRFEPITWLAAIAAVTQHIGLVATASTSYYEPYNLARLFSTLDQISGGRAGWNIVTTSAALAAGNFGDAPQAGYAQRYERAAEFVDVVKSLWDSWEDGALVADAASGVFADTARIHPIHHHGAYFDVDGAFNMPRSPQGYPVLVQAGSSETGREFAATYAEAVFTAHQTIADGRAFYQDIKTRTRRLGRSEESIRVLPGICPFIGSTEAEAKRLYVDLNDLIQTEFSLAQLGKLLGTDLKGMPLDRRLPIEELAQTSPLAASSRFQVIAGIVHREDATIREVISKLAGARGHREIIGTPEQVADAIVQWVQEGAADGFNVMPPWIPGGFNVFADEVIPLLQRRGVFRRAYEGNTLRDHLGLKRPVGHSGAAVLN